MKTLKINQLRPTQMTHGVREIRQKTEAYAKLTGHDLEMAIAEKPIPVCTGPVKRHTQSTITTSPPPFGGRK